MAADAADGRFACVSAAWAAHEGELRDFPCRRLDDPTAAGDLLQHVFLKAMHPGERFCTLDNPRAWWFAVARNTLADRARLTRVQVPNDDPADALGMADGHDHRSGASRPRLRDRHRAERRHRGHRGPGRLGDRLAGAAGRRRPQPRRRRRPGAGLGRCAGPACTTCMCGPWARPRSRSPRTWRCPTRPPTMPFCGTSPPSCRSVSGSATRRCRSCANPSASLARVSAWRLTGFPMPAAVAERWRCPCASPRLERGQARLVPFLVGSMACPSSHQ